MQATAHGVAKSRTQLSDFTFLSRSLGSRPWGSQVALKNKQTNKQKKPACECRRHKETQVQSQGQEDPLEEGLVTHSSILA